MAIAAPPQCAEQQQQQPKSMTMDASAGTKCRVTGMIGNKRQPCRDNDNEFETIGPARNCGTDYAVIFFSLKGNNNFSKKERDTNERPYGRCLRWASNRRKRRAK